MAQDNKNPSQPREQQQREQVQREQPNRQQQPRQPQKPGMPGHKPGQSSEQDYDDNNRA